MNSEYSDLKKQICKNLRQAGMSHLDIELGTGVPVSVQQEWEKAEEKRCTGIVFQDGLLYKIGVRGKLFYQDADNEWRLSNRSPEEIIDL